MHHVTLMLFFELTIMDSGQFERGARLKLDIVFFSTSGLQRRESRVNFRAE